MHNPSFSTDDFWSYIEKYEKTDSSGQKEKDLFCNRDQVQLYQEIDSTNTELKRRLENCSAMRNSQGQLTDYGKKHHLSLAASAKQTAGRGRLGRPFYSPTETGIYFSFVFAPEGGVQNPALYTAASVVGVCRAISYLFGIESSIKWVNDIYINGKKVCGILTEGVLSLETGKVEAAIVGIGINLTVNKDLPKELEGKAGGVFAEKKALEDYEDRTGENARVQLLSRCIWETYRILNRGEDFFPEYRKRSFLPGNTVTVSPVIGEEKTAYKAKVLDVTQDAGLLVECEDGSQKVLYSGEVTLHQQ